MDLSVLTVNTVVAFLLVLFRISGMLVSAPLFNMRAIPPQAKIGLAFAMALIFFPLHMGGLMVPTDLIQFALLAIQETLIGLLLGFTANLMFLAIQMAGEFISVQMGLSVAQVLDPVTQTNSPVMGQFFFYLAAILFLTLNIHHGLIVGIDKSFQWLPLGQFVGGEGALSGGALTVRLMKLTADMFLIALAIGLPVMGILLLSEVALGFVAKVMPQMNVFMVGIPLKVALGLLVIMISLPLVGEVLGHQYANLVQVLLGLYRT